MGMIGAGEMVKLRGPQRPSLRLQSCWPPAPSRRARLAVHTVGASFGPSSRNLVQYSQLDVLAVLRHSFAASRALRVRNRYRKTKTSKCVILSEVAHPRLEQVYRTMNRAVLKRGQISRCPDIEALFSA